MKNLNEKDIRKVIKNFLKEKYEGGQFDEFEFDNDARQAAMADIQDSGEEFEELGSSKFEKSPQFKEKFKSALKQANLGLSSDEQEVERLAQSIKKKKAHEKQFGVGSMNENFEELEGPQPGDAEYHNDYEKMPTGLSKFSDIDWVAIYEMLKSGELLSRNDLKEVGLTEEDINLLYHYNIISALDYTLFDEVTSLETFIKQVEDAYKQGFNESVNEGPMKDVFDTTNLYKFLKDMMWALKEGDGSDLDYAQAAQFVEQELVKNFDIKKKNIAQHSLTEADFPELMKQFKDNMEKEMTPKAPSNETPEERQKRISTELARLKAKELERRKEAGENLNEENDAKTNRYMFFSNLEQLKRQSALMLGLDQQKVSDILESGHDWAQDHVATAKESMDQVFDFIMNETKKEKEETVEESNIRSHANGRGQNLKSKNYPKSFKRDALKEEYDFAGEERTFHNQQNFEDEMDEEVYFVVDNDFNKSHYPDLIGQTFDTPPAYAQVKLIKKGESIDTNRTLGDKDVQENSSDSLMNAHGENAKPETLDEVTDTERYEQVVTLDGNEAAHALNILMQDGKDEAMEYLKQWHQPGQGMGSETLGHGSMDKTYEKDGYIMNWNSSLGYIGLVHDTEYGKDLDEDSQMKRHQAGQREKTVPLGQHAPHSQKAKK